MNDATAHTATVTSAEPVLQSQGLSKTFRQGSQSLEVLREVNLTVRHGERIAIVGSSGAGKSTLLQLLGGLDTPTAGEVIIAGQNLTRLSDAARSRVRNRLLGFIYQFHHLLPEFSALENAAMPLLIRGLKPVQATEQATALLQQVGLGERLSHKPGQLSGGERQRAAVARALITNPACVLADEPTGNLDRRTAAQVFDVMLNLNRQAGASLIIVTHDPALAAQMDATWRLQDGLLVREA